MRPDVPISGSYAGDTAFKNRYGVYDSSVSQRSIGVAVNGSSYLGEQTTFRFLTSPEVVAHFANVVAEERGAVFTRPEVVELILNLAEYTTDQPLHTCRLLEPCIGNGDFLLPAIERLLTSYESQASSPARIVEDLADAIRAVEVDRQRIERTRTEVLKLLQRHRLGQKDAKRLCGVWLIEGDFLLVDLPHRFSHAVGNPPYVRQELVPDALMTEYRARYATIYDRADLYVPFFERCLNALEPGGVLGFICADRWMKNRYGKLLRAMIARGYRLSCYVDMVGTPAFQSDVIAYPAITIIRRENAGPTRIAYRPHVDSNTLKALGQAMLADTITEGTGVFEVARVTDGQAPWMLQSPDRLAVIRRLEAAFPTLEDVGCKVGIGVATGADKAFIGPFDELDVEPDRKLPLVMTKDIESGVVVWKGLGVINPFEDDGSLVTLAKYPKLRLHLEAHSDVIRKRNCAKKNPRRWYRTIDRINPELTHRPKLLIPDIKGEAHIVYEGGAFYPHHNLYFITSQEWDLKALQVVLRSGIAKLFVSMYSTQMRGGFLRFQAQYLRRIRLPRWQDVPPSVRSSLLKTAEVDGISPWRRAVFDLYRLTRGERQAITEVTGRAGHGH